MSKRDKRPFWFVVAALAPLMAAAPVIVPSALDAQTAWVKAGPVSKLEAHAIPAGGAAFWQAASADAEAQVESLLDHLSDHTPDEDVMDPASDQDTLKLKDSLSRMLEANRQLCPQKDKGSRTS